MGLVKSEDAETDSTRNRFDPLRMQDLAVVWGQCSSLKPGTRTSVPSGIQSPGTPSADTALARTGPNADGPKRAIGSTTPSAVRASSSIRLPSESDSTVRKLPSAAA